MASKVAADLLSTVNNREIRKLEIDKTKKKMEEFQKVANNPETKAKLTLNDFIEKEKNLFNKFKTQYDGIVSVTGGKTAITK